MKKKKEKKKKKKQTKNKQQRRRQTVNHINPQAFHILSCKISASLDFEQFWIVCCKPTGV